MREFGSKANQGGPGGARRGATGDQAGNPGEGKGPGGPGEARKGTRGTQGGPRPGARGNQVDSVKAQTKKTPSAGCFWLGGGGRSKVLDKIDAVMLSPSHHKAWSLLCSDSCKGPHKSLQLVMLRPSPHKERSQVKQGRARRGPEQAREGARKGQKGGQGEPGREPGGPGGPGGAGKRARRARRGPGGKVNVSMV